jgi:predicted kinase
MVIVLTGAPGSGKSTVAGLLAARLDRAAHVPVDFFRKMIKGGYASPHHWSDEVDRQYRIARASAAQTAHNLAAGGFIPILDDIVPAAWVDEWRAALTGLDCRFVALRPRLDVALRRNRERSIWTVDESVLAELHAMLEGPHTDGWLVVDNSEGSPDETATAVAGGLELITPSR